MYAFHVVTDRHLDLRERLVFDENHHNGVYQRAADRLGIVMDIYSHPEKYDPETLEHHTRVALRELALEKLRVQQYPQYPSRMACLYVSNSMADAEAWAELFIKWGRPTYSIVKVNILGRIFVGDARNCFDATLNEAKNLLLAERYWANSPNVQDKTSITEILADGAIEIIGIVREINKNI